MPARPSTKVGRGRGIREWVEKYVVATHHEVGRVRTSLNPRPLGNSGMAGTGGLTGDPEKLNKLRKSFRHYHSVRDGCSLLHTFGPLVADAIFDAPWQKDIYEVLLRQPARAWTFEELYQEVSCSPGTLMAPS